MHQVSKAGNHKAWPPGALREAQGVSSGARSLPHARGAGEGLSGLSQPAGSSRGQAGGGDGAWSPPPHTHTAGFLEGGLAWQELQAPGSPASSSGSGEKAFFYPHVESLPFCRQRVRHNLWSPSHRPQVLASASLRHQPRLLLTEGQVRDWGACPRPEAHRKQIPAGDNPLVSPSMSLPAPSLHHPLSSSKDLTVPTPTDERAQAWQEGWSTIINTPLWPPSSCLADPPVLC